MNINKILWSGLLLCLITGSAYARDLVFSAELPVEYHKYDFDEPSDVFVDAAGYMFVANTGKKCVQRFNPRGELEKEFYGENSDMLSQPIGVAVDSRGNVFVADAELKCVLGFNKDGDVFSVWGKGDIGKPAGITIEKDVVYVTDSDKNCVWEFDGKRLTTRKIGETGTASGQFQSPTGIVYNPNNEMLYVVDTGNHRIQKIYTAVNPPGIFVWLGDTGKFGTITGISTNNGQLIFVTAKKEDVNGRYEYVYGFDMESQEKKIQWGGSAGFSDRQFGDSAGLFVSNDGMIFVVDKGNNSIQKITNKGQFVGLLSKYSFEKGRFNSPVDMCFDSKGNMFVVDKNNHRIQRFDKNGQFINVWGGKSTMLEWGKFDSPSGIAIDRGNGDRVYVVDSKNNRIQRFNNSSMAALDPLGKLGGASGELKSPQDIAIDSTGNAFVVDSVNERIQVFDRLGNVTAGWSVKDRPLDIEVIEAMGVKEIYVVCHTAHVIRVYNETGNLQRTIGQQGYDVDSGQFQYPCGIAKDSSNRLYVLDRGNKCLHIMDRFGQTLGIWKWKVGMAQEEIYNPEGIAIDDKDNIYIADTGNHRIQRFKPLDFVPSGGVAGTVTNHGTPVHNARVEIKRQDTGLLVSTVYTDSTGRYSLDGIPMGTYSVMVFKDGYGTGYAMKAVSIKPNNVSLVEEVVLVPLAPVISSEVALHNYPNPFDPCDGDMVMVGSTSVTTDGTVIYYNLPVKVDSVFMEIYNLAGELIWEWEGNESASQSSSHHIPWNGKSKDGNIVADGVYFCVFTADGKVETCKIAVKK